MLILIQSLNGEILRWGRTGGFLSTKTFSKKDTRPLALSHFKQECGKNWTPIVLYDGFDFAFVVCSLTMSSSDHIIESIWWPPLNPLPSLLLAIRVIACFNNS